MNLKKLKKAESDFLFRYPGGFNHPDMVAIGKKHKMDKMIDLTQSSFKVSNFSRPNTMIDNLVNVISRSSMVSMFEKPKFKSFAGTLTPLEKELLADGLQERLYGNQQHGFEVMLDILQTHKMAKWTIISICPTYFLPTSEVFVKPTTVKGIINKLELRDLQYNPKPSWSFYNSLRTQINEMKTKVDPDLSPSNAAFTGFLMMSLVN